MKIFTILFDARNKDVSPTVKTNKQTHKTKLESAFNIRSAALSKKNDVSGDFLIQIPKRKE